MKFSRQNEGQCQNDETEIDPLVYQTKTRSPIDVVDGMSLHRAKCILYKITDEVENKNFIIFVQSSNRLNTIIAEHITNTEVDCCNGKFRETCLITLTEIQRL